MAKLTEAHKLYIVQRLAAFRTPQEVATEFKEQFGMEIDRSHVFRYDPTRPGYLNSAKWKGVFADARERYLEQVNAIPIANLAYRLDVHQKLLSDQMAKGARRNEPLILSILEQAAKDCGGIYTNRREVTGKNGSPLLPADPETVAKAVLRRIVKEGVLPEKEAVEWVAKRYKIEPVKLISEANN